MKYSVQRSQRPRQAAGAPEAPLPKSAEASFNANMQLAYLESVVKDWREKRKSEPPQPAISPPEAPVKRTAKEPVASRPSSNFRPTMVIKSCLAIAVALGLGWMPIQRLLATTSAEAVVNARLITLRAPIEGDVSMAIPGADIGTQFRNDQQILTIDNPRSDASRLTSLERDRDQLRATIAALEGKKQLLLTTFGELTAQQERFRLGRIEQLVQRVRETDADIASAEAQHTMASAALLRASSLKKTDAVSQAFLDKAVQDDRVLQESVRALGERRKGMLVELNAAKAGTFIGDSYNDTPQSAQRKTEVALDLADVGARLEGSKAELASLQSDIADERKRHAQLSTAVLRSTVNGRIWAMLTAPGEHVNAGQDLLQLLDCNSAMVTASVSETAYQRLAVGQRATFRPRDAGKGLQGWVAGLNGLAAVASNSAIQQSALSREPYHVTLKFPELARGADCQIGRAGLVTFDTGSLPDSATAP